MGWISFLLHNPVDSFVLPSSSHLGKIGSTASSFEYLQQRLRSSQISAVKGGRGGKGPGAKAKGGKKKKKKIQQGGGGKKKSGNKENNGVPNSASTKASSSAHLPPWQVMSEKDAKENIRTEKIRRESIRKGELDASVSTLLDEEKSGDVNASSSLLSLTDRQLFNWKRFRPDRDIGGMEFQGAYLGTRLPPLLGVPEVAFLGRSNVGKSSLLNELSKKASQSTTPGTSSDKARVGKTPGATASVNLYSLQNNKTPTNKPLLGFVDLPGFGYAKLSKDVKESVEMAAERYLGKRRELALGILLVDIRRVPSDDDRAVLAALYDLGIPLMVVATKSDKIRSAKAHAIALEEIRVGLGLPQGQPLCISSETGENVKQLWGIILDACEDRVEELKEEMQKGKKNSDEYDDGGTIKLDDEGNWIEETPTDEGLEWIQSFSYYDDQNTSKSDSKIPSGISEESRRKMKENEEMQAAQNEAQKVRNLKKVARKMQRKGQL